jgi:hypothetical protein
MGATMPGSYVIDPDGHAGEHDPIEVECSLDDGQGTF